MAIKITRTDYTAKDLRRQAAKSTDADQARRLLALALVLEGSTRTQAAEACGMERQTLRDWVHRYNAEGICGLVDRKPTGPKSRLTPAQEGDLIEMVENGPDPAKDGVVRWRRIDLRDIIESQFGVELHVRSVGKLLHRLGFRHLSVRPRHPKADVAAQEAFKKTSPSWLARSFRTKPRPSPSKSGSRTKPASVRREA